MYPMYQYAEAVIKQRLLEADRHRARRAARADRPSGNVYRRVRFPRRGNDAIG